MLNFDQKANTNVHISHDDFLKMHGSFDRRIRACQIVLGDQGALDTAARNTRIVADYLAGQFTMREIGAREGISHERVRQVLSDEAPGYKEARKERVKAAKAEKLLSKDVRREAAFHKLWGCDSKQFAEILKVFPDSKLRFRENKGNAHTMKRPWNMTFWEWATCWI